MLLLSVQTVYLIISHHLIIKMTKLANRTKSKSKKTRLFNKINELKRKYNKAVEQQAFQQQLDLLNEINVKSTLAYHQICRIKNRTIKSRDFCDLQTMLEHQRDHFNAVPHKWTKKETIESEFLKSKLIAKQIFTRKVVERELRHLNEKKLLLVKFQHPLSNVYPLIALKLFVIFLSYHISLEIYLNHGQKLELLRYLRTKALKMNQYTIDLLVTSSFEEII